MGGRRQISYRTLASYGALTWGGALVLSGMLGATSCTIRNKPNQAKPGGELACEQSEECPAPQTPCLISMCLDGVCVFVPAPQGPLPAQDQVQGDCQHLYCDGNGETESYASPPDIPAEDNNRCTEAACEDGAPVQRPHAAGMVCGDNKLCTGTGFCGVCLPQQQRCDGHAIAQCDERGQWQQQRACSAPKPVCRASQCTGVAQLTAGRDHACARFDDDSVRCWGADRVGWSRAAKPQSRWTDGFVQLAVGPGHACGLSAQGAVRCWGRNDYGQLGAGNFDALAAPQQVALGPARQLAVGREHSCALLRDGSVWCWGRNDRGQLASGVPRKAPPGLTPPGASGTAIRGPQLLAELSGGGELRSPGSELCVKSNAGFSCFGALPRYAPSDFPPAAEEDDDSARVQAIDERKKVARFSAAKVAGLSRVEQLGCGDDHCCARTSAGTVSCWGAGDRVQLGQPGPDRPAVKAVAGVSSARALVVGAAFACVLHADGSVSCWGDNRQGQLGRKGVERGPAAKLAGIEGVTQLMAGRAFACALDKAGAVHCWGANSHGQSARSEAAAVSTATAVTW